MCCDEAGGRVLHPKVVLDVPIFGKRCDLGHHLLPVFKRTMQADQIAKVGVDADVGQADIGDE